MWIQKTENIGVDSLFREVMFIGFDGFNKNKLIIQDFDGSAWDDAIAWKFIDAVFGPDDRLQTRDVYENIRGLAVTKAFDFLFCRRAAYYLRCADMAERMRVKSGEILRPGHFWINPENESEMEAW